MRRELLCRTAPPGRVRANARSGMTGSAVPADFSRSPRRKAGARRPRDASGGEISSRERYESGPGRKGVGSDLRRVLMDTGRRQGGDCNWSGPEPDSASVEEGQLKSLSQHETWPGLTGRSAGQISSAPTIPGPLGGGARGHGPKELKGRPDQFLQSAPAVGAER